MFGNAGLTIASHFGSRCKFRMLRLGCGSKYQTLCGLCSPLYGLMYDISLALQRHAHSTPQMAGASGYDRRPLEDESESKFCFCFHLLKILPK